MADRLDLPYFPLWVDDWLASPHVNAMTPEQEGAFIRLLMLAWRSDPPCTLPDDDRILAGMSRLGSRWKRVGALVKAQFPLVDGRLRNAKLFAVYLESVARHEAAVQKGKLGGRPSKVEDKSKDKPGETSALPQPKLGETNKEGEEEKAQSQKQCPAGAERDVASEPIADSPSPVVPAGPDEDTGAKAAKPKGLVPTQDEAAVLEHYRAVYPKRKAAGDAPIRLVRRALAMGYSVMDLEHAIDGNHEDEWHAARAKHELEYVMRSGETIDHFVACYEQQNTPMTDANGRLTPAGARELYGVTQ